MITAIIFDAEGVVIDTERVWDDAQEQLLREAGRDYDRAAVKPLLTGRSSLEGALVLKELYDLEESVEEIARRRRELMTHLLGVKVDFMPGFLDFFDRVASAYKVAIATAMDPELFDLVDDRLHLRGLFANQVVTLLDAGNRSKPDPELFLVAARSLGVVPSDCVVIEDSPYGIQAARLAGMRSIGLATTYGPEQLDLADVVARSYSEIHIEDLDPAGD